MNEKQKEAIMILNRLLLHKGGKLISDDEYFILLDFVVTNKSINIEYPSSPWYETITKLDFNPKALKGPFGDRKDEEECNHG